MREKNKDIQYMKVLIIMLLFLTTMTMSVSAESSPKSVLNKYYTTSLGTKKMFQSYPGSYVYKGGIKGNDLILYGSLDVYDAKTGKMLVCVNPQWFRPTDVDNLWGDPTKAKTVLGWNPQETSYEELVNIMAKHDRELAKREKALKEAK